MHKWAAFQNRWNLRRKKAGTRYAHFEILVSLFVGGIQVPGPAGLASPMFFVRLRLQLVNRLRKALVHIVGLCAGNKCARFGLEQDVCLVAVLFDAQCSVNVNNVVNVRGHFAKSLFGVFFEAVRYLDVSAGKVYLHCSLQKWALPPKNNNNTMIATQGAIPLARCGPTRADDL
jgi:hypothetical protein